MRQRDERIRLRQEAAATRRLQRLNRQQKAT
jgi:hypothetical protein